MKLLIPKGATSRIVTVFIQANNVTTGAGLSGLTNASSIVGGYVREGGTGVALAVDEDVTTEGTYQAPSAAGKVRIGTPANMTAGTYELHFHNDLWATGAEGIVITLGGATNMAVLTIEVQLTDPVRGVGSPTALPNAAADAAGGLIISDAGGLDADAILADTNELQTDWVNGGRLDLLIDAIIAAIDTVDNFLDTEMAAVLEDTSTTLDDLVDDLEGRLTAALATALTAHALGIGRGVVDTGSTTTAVVFELVNGATPSAVDDFYNGRHIVFTSGALTLQQTSISDYTGATKTATVPALTGAPADDVTFLIV